MISNVNCDGDWFKEEDNDDESYYMFYYEVGNGNDSSVNESQLLFYNENNYDKSGIESYENDYDKSSIESSDEI